MKHWAYNYIGIPYRIGGREKDGIDCWGLIRLIYKEVRGIELPSHPGIVTGDLRADSAEIAREARESWVETSKPAEGDVVAMSQRTLLHHVGIWTEADGGKVIHCWEGGSVVADTVRNLKLKGVRVIRYFSYGLHN